MTEDRYAELVVNIWRLRRQRRKLNAELQRRGLVVKLRDKLRANPAVAEHVKVMRQLKAAAQELAFGE